MNSKSRTPSAPVLVAIALVLAAVALAGCGGNGDSDTTDTGGEAPAGAETTTEAAEPSGNAAAPSGEAVRSQKVEIADYEFGPPTVTIQVGGKVTWINRDPVAHTATAEDESFDTGPIEEGKIASETFKQPGSYPYICSIHPYMKGTIEVVEKD